MVPFASASNKVFKFVARAMRRRSMAPYSDRYARLTEYLSRGHPPRPRSVTGTGLTEYKGIGDDGPVHSTSTSYSHSSELSLNKWSLG